jgi:acyl-CoA synthetase (NDP forming)
VVIFYKAGRTAPGRSAAAGHTAAVAGDYEICQAAATHAGALVVDTFKEFEQLLELAAAFHDRRIHGVRLGAITNAGFEAVGMADAIRGQRYAVEMAALPDATAERLEGVLARHHLDRLVNPRNPLDLTPMAAEAAYEDAVGVFLECDAVDAAVVGIVPLTAALGTAPGEMEGESGLPARLGRLFRESAKPLIAVVDSGPRYLPLVEALRAEGVPVFPSADQAVRSLGRYLCHRVDIQGSIRPEGHRDREPPAPGLG